MPPTNSANWLQYALQQMAAESYLNDLDLRNQEEVKVRLRLGNNVNDNALDAELLRGKTRFTEVLADRFLSRYQIVDHHANDATGFSATLLFDTSTNQYTLSIRSTESQDAIEGGDWERDGIPGADGEIKDYGFALAQLVSLERYWRALSAPGGPLAADVKINVTGFSLGGHLATVFTELHAANVLQTVTFNGAGRGFVAEKGHEEQPIELTMQHMLTDLEARILAFDPEGALFQSGATENIYADARYDLARANVLGTGQPQEAPFRTIGTGDLLFFPIPAGMSGGIETKSEGFDKITQLVGWAATGVDVQFVTNSGIHAAPTGVLIEGQPLVESVREREYANSHSLTLIVDSLALQDLFQTVDGSLSQSEIETIFKASSEAKAGVFGSKHQAEGDTLENALDGLRRIVLGPDIQSTRFNDNGGGFGDLARRNEFYTNLEQVRTAVQGQSLQIVSLVDMPTETLKGYALQPGEAGVAYRYALQSLNPFVVLGADYSQFHTPGEFDLVDSETGNGALTLKYLADRASLLAKVIERNLRNGPSFVDQFNSIHWKDYAVGKELQPGVLFSLTPREYVFGGQENDTLVGNIFSDHLYGGGGADTIYGGASADYIEGNDNDDVLLNGEGGNDTILGGQGNDLLVGGAGADTLDGGQDDDRLEGGTGADRYVYFTGQGQDRIKDTDQLGSIVFDRQVLVGGIRRQGDPLDTYRSLDGKFAFVKQGTELVINGALTIEDFDFKKGSLGIKLSEVGDLADGVIPTIDYGTPVSTETYQGTENNDVIDVSGGAIQFSTVVNGLGGNDYLVSLSPYATDEMYGGDGSDALSGGMDHDKLYGDRGDDVLVGGAGKDLLYGGDGRDLLIGDWASGTLSTPDADYLDGGAEDDVLQGQEGNDILYGGEGNDELYGDDSPGSLAGQMFDNPVPRRVGADYLDGGEGDDLLAAGLGDDVVYGQAGNDVLYGDNSPVGNTLVWGGGLDAAAFNGFVVNAVVGGRQAFFSPEGGADYLDGGEGDDYLQGDGGDDILLGGAGADQLWGDDTQIAAVLEGDDWLEGGVGNDLLVGGGGEDALFGGDDDDVLVGDYVGNPTLGFNDSLDGGAGNDELQGGGGADLLEGGTGNDRLFGQDGDDTLYGGAGDDIGLGGEGDDFLSGEEGDDRLDGEAGDDLLLGDEGNDILYGGAGQDLLDGGAGDDVLIAGDDDDILFGREGADELQGGAGADLLVGELGDDRLFGGEGHDQLFGDEGNDLLRGEADNDVLFGGAGQDRLFGDEGDDYLSGEAGADILDGGAGDDVLEGGTGDDRVEGGSGADTYVFHRGDGQDTIIDAVGEGNLLRFGAGITPGELRLTPVAGALVIQVGSTGDQLTILGFSAGHVEAPFAIDRYEFADGTVLTHAELVARGFSFVGTAGSDVLVADTNGLNTLAGWAGDDTYVVHHETDRIVEYAGHGVDTVYTSVDFTLPDQVENLFAVAGEGESGGPVRLTGNQLGNVVQGPRGVTTDNLLEGLGGSDELFGFEGNDILDGGAGDDLLDGGAGNDTYLFGLGDGHDVASEQTASGTDIDTVQFKTGVSPADVRLQLVRNPQTNGFDLAVELVPTGDRLTLRGRLAERMIFADGTVWDAAAIEARTEGLTLTAPETGAALYGTSYADTLIGLSGNDYLDGGGEADTMIGGDGNDIYVVDHPGDTVIEAAGQGRDTVESFIDYTLPDHVENLQLKGSEFQGALPITGIGNALDNELRGNLLNNVLKGEDGQDVLMGFGGDDVLIGGAGDDAYFYNGGPEGVDTIYDTARPGEGNRLVLGGAIRPEALTFTESSDALQINLGAAQGTIVLKPDDSAAGNGTAVVEYVEFGHQLGSQNPGFEIALTELRDVSLGTDGSDVMEGTAGVDVLRAGAGDDLLIGGAGNDILSGGAGHDTYVFNLGDGVDLIDDLALPGAPNLVQFGVGITPDMLRVETSGASYQALLTIHVGSGGDALQLLGWYPSDPASPRAVDMFEFADGTRLSFDDLLAGGTEVRGTNADDGELFGTFAIDWLFGFEGSESLSGGLGDDVLIGGPGNDILSGGKGSDTYVYNLGDGTDEIHDQVNRLQVPLDENRILFGPGITLGDLNWSDRDGSLFVSVGSDGAGLDLGSYWDARSFGIQTLELADGTTIDMKSLIQAVAHPNGVMATGGEGDNLLVGGEGADTLVGGSGSNLMLGGDGHDQLVGGSGLNQMYGGAGNDVLVGGASQNIMHGGSGSNLLLAGSGSNTFLIDTSSAFNTIVFPTPPVPGNNRVQFDGSYDQFSPSLGLGSLMIRYGTEGGQLHIEGFDPSKAYENPGIETFAFSDRVLTYRELIDLGFDLSGTDGADLMLGTSATDRMQGLEGNDELRAGEGNDELTGGQGDDLLVGGAGHDAYFFNLGDGSDTIVDAVTMGGGNEIRFGAGIASGDLLLTEDPETRTLTIAVGSQGDAIRLTHFDRTGEYGTSVVQTLVFDDGSRLTLADILGGSVNHEPTIAQSMDNQTVAEAVPFAIAVPAETFADEDGDALALSADLASGDPLPTWLQFDPTTGTFHGVPDDAQVGTWDLRVTATDAGELSVADTFSLTVTNVNEAPVLVEALPTQLATEKVPYSFTIPTSTFTDEDQVHGDTLTYRAAVTNGMAWPAWLTFDPASRTFSGTPSNADVGTLALTVVATDRDGLSAETNLTLTVENVNDAPTVAHPIDEQAAAEDSPFTLVVPSQTFADEDLIHGDSLWLSATGADNGPLPNWLHFDQATGTFAGTPGPGDAGTYHLMVTATDGEGASVSTGVTLNVSGPLPRNVVGTEEQDVLAGGRGDDFLQGLGGDDRLVGGDGNDWLDGGAGADQMIGGLGDDTYVIEQPGDLVTEECHGGMDTIRSSISYTLGSDLEQLILTGTDAINGTGNALDNALVGNGASNVLRGGEGNDTYVVGIGDRVIEEAGEGKDTVQSEISWTLEDNVERLILTGEQDIEGFGNSLDNELVGNRGANTLDGGSGNDTIDGMDGQDLLIGGSGHDVLVGGMGDDVLFGGSGSDNLQGGAGADWLDGGSGNDWLAGGEDHDVLFGGSGSDVLAGGAGQDLLDGGSGDDRYLFARGDGDDTIVDHSGTDRLSFESDVTPLDLIISRQVNDLRVSLYGTSDQVTISNWYGGESNQLETITVGEGQDLINSQVDQLIQAMASFTEQTGLSWEDAIAQRPQDVQAVLAASWQ